MSGKRSGKSKDGTGVITEHFTRSKKSTPENTGDTDISMDNTARQRSHSLGVQDTRTEAERSGPADQLAIHTGTENSSDVSANTSTCSSTDSPSARAQPQPGDTRATNDYVKLDSSDVSVDSVVTVAEDTSKTAEKTKAMLTKTAASDLDKMELRIMDLLKKMDSKMDVIEKTTTDMKVEVDNRLMKMESVLGENSKKLSDLEGSLNYAHRDIADQKEKTGRLEKDAKELREKLNNGQKQGKLVARELETMKLKMAEELLIERRSRSYSIRVLGVPADVSRQANDHQKVVAEILSRSDLVPSRLDANEVARTMEKAHPLGKPVNDKVNYIARFFARPDRDDVMRRARGKRELQGAERIVEDLTKADLELKKRARPLMEKAYKDGNRVRFQNGKLIIEGREVPIPSS